MMCNKPFWNWRCQCIADRLYGERNRAQSPSAARIWNLAGYYGVTDALTSGSQRQRQPTASAGLMSAPLPVRMPRRK